MAELTTEELAQRILGCRLLDNKQLNDALSALGGRNIDANAFRSHLLKEGLLTNWQLTRIIDGHNKGYFYGNWKVLYLVGAGTFARVYRSVNNKTGDVKAVKVLRNRYTDDMLTRERFMREAQTVMKLRHTNIVPIYEVESQRGRIYMVMDFIEGQNLREFVKAHGKVRVEVALTVTRDVCNGLAYAAQQGVTHRDIKLSNVLLSSSGRACLVDFGLAAADDNLDKRLGGFFNPRSVDYAGLEKTTNAPRNDKRSDVFFVGCNLYHMLSGEPPLFETRERMKRMSSDRYRHVPPLSTLNPELPHRVVALTNSLMTLNPDDRIQTAREAMEITMDVIKALKDGDRRRYDESLSEQEAAEYAKLKNKITEGEGNTVMIVESNTTVQNTLRKNLKNIGYRVLILSDPTRALERFRDLDPAEESPASCVIFGSAGLGFAAIEAFNEFMAYPIGRTVPSVILVKEDRMKEFRGKMTPLAHHRILALPVKFPKIRAALQDLLGIEPEKQELDEEA